MLRKLTIRHFKSIYDAELVLGRANLFVGPNGSGKSNILEVLGLLGACLSRGLDPTSLDERGIRLSVPTLFKSAFKKTELPKTFRIEATFDKGKYICSIRAGVGRPSLEFHSEALYQNGVKIFGRGPNGIDLNREFAPKSVIRNDAVDNARGLWDILSPILEIDEVFRGELDQISDFSIYAPQTAIMRGVAVDPRVKQPLGLTGAGLASAFQQAIFTAKDTGITEAMRKRVLDIIWQPGWADQIRTAPFDPTIVPPNIKSDGTLLYIRDRFMQRNRNYLNAADASEGTLYLIFVATLLAHNDTPRTFGLDNVDGTLNPRLVRQLTKAIVDVCVDPNRLDVSEGSRQVFVTSHHPSALDSFDIFEQDQAIFVTHRDTNADLAVGSSRFERLKPAPGMTKEQYLARQRGKNLSVMLLDNLIPDAL